ncbi:dTDP-4-dehydrorhamnose reductase [Novosphingobium sp. FSY-8]|uniref:dTDP-4-dehydrorhamnose reductase n=1 Tax=Novosphingobium ovatum TaxID=1908523 RepID=A0ABW9XGJ8_9SPHN|nr:dTDP-4-dehydrorhamnose reductase [Novosphingobium ovatum]NBC37680.1 dTDP-4-dehydrorhamnose reductase [Novosphingobium ovatum]
MRIAVTGLTGQVVRALAERAEERGDEVIAIGRPQLDLAMPDAVAGALDRAFCGAMPDAVVSAAAYTAVDRAESEADLAMTINAKGAAAVAAWAHGHLLPVVHLSTDYVFDGAKATPYDEDDAVAPQGAYGASKLAGEQAVMAAHPGAVILRTAWVYSPFGHNFVKTMLRLAQDRDEIGVVADQIGNPTSALDIADGVLDIIEALTSHPGATPRGVFHMTAAGEASWADFARAIFAASAAQGGPVAQVRAIATADYPTPAQRPANSRLDCGFLAMAYGVRLPDWRAALPTVVARILTETARPEHVA